MLAIHRKYQPYLLLAVTYVTVLFAYHSTLHDLVRRWTQWDQSQSHGLVIIVLSIFLYLQRLDPGNLAKKNNPAVATGIILLSLCWALSAAVSVDIVEQLCLFLLFILMQFSLFGLKYSKPLLGPVGLLIFAVPIWDYLSPPLVELSSLVVTRMLNMSHLTAYINGNSIFLPFGTIVIADGCSGLRYLIIALALVIYLILTSRINVSKALLIIAISSGLGLFVNWIRIYSIVMIAYKTRMQSGLIENHETFGWLLFIIVVIPIFFFANRLGVYKHHKNNWPYDQRSRKVIAATILFFLTGPLLLLLHSTSLSQPDTIKTGEEIDFTSLGFTTVDIKIKSDPVPDKQISLKYGDKDTVIYTTSVFYWQKQTGDSLVPYLHPIIDTSTWKINSIKKYKLANNINAIIYVLEHKLTSENRISLHWFTVGGFTTSSYTMAKLLQYPAILGGKNLFEFTKFEAVCMDRECLQEQEKIIDVAERLIMVLNQN